MKQPSATALIVDDETLSGENLRQLLGRTCPEISVVGLARHIDEALDLIRSLNPQLVFLDIELPGGTGFSILEHFPDLPFEVIFTTAFEQHAIRAIRCSALDYLLKPVQTDELRESVQKFLQKQYPLGYKKHVEILKQHLYPHPEGSLQIALPCQEGYEVIHIPDIMYCEGSSNYTYFHLSGNDRILVSRTLKECDQLLHQFNFFRVHQSFLVNMSFIKKYNKGAGGMLLMRNGAEIPVASRRKDEFITRLHRL